MDNASGASAVNIQDGGNSITVDGTIAATQSGTWDINDISGTISLPTGAATETTLGNVETLLTTIESNQLGDGHNVTIDNSSGASAVNIQDGGNSITVDNAALSVTGGGTEASALRVTIANNSTGVLSVDDNGGSLTVDGTVTADQGGSPWQIEGELAAGAAVSGTNPILMGGQNLSGNLTVPTLTTVSGLNVFAAVPIDLTGNSPDFTSSGEHYVLGHSTDGTKANADYALIDSNQNTRVVGDIDHDSADSGSPLLMGGRAHTSEPSAVANNDRVRAYFDENGYLRVKATPRRTSVTNLTTLEDTYDNTTTTNTSSSVDVQEYRSGRFYWDAEVGTGTPTDIVFDVEFSHDDTNWYKFREDFWHNYRFTDTTIDTGFSEAVVVKNLPNYIRFVVTCNGTDASNTFVVNDAYFEAID